MIATYGEPLLRLSSGAGRQIKNGAALGVAVGGAELNVAVALAALGRTTRFISAIPDSFVGDKVLTELRAHGVLTDSIRRVSGARIGLYFVEQACAPRGHRVVYDRAGSAFAVSDTAPGALAGADTLVVSGITAALGEGPATRLGHLVAEARQRGIRIAVDVNYRALLWSPAAAAAALPPLLRAADVLVCAARDARTLFGLAGPAQQCAGALRERYAPDAELVVVTDSSDGAAAASGHGQWRVPALRTDVVDRFGAGDAFMAGLLWSITAGESPDDALSAGVALAAMACTVDGDTAAFSEPELRAVLDDPRAVMVR